MDIVPVVCFALIMLFSGGVMVGRNLQKPDTRQETIYLCVQKPKECKKEYDFYQLEKEVETMKRNQK